MALNRRRVLAAAAGVALLAAGLFIGARVGMQLLQQQDADRSQNRAWQDFTRAVQGQDAGTVPAPSGPVTAPAATVTAPAGPLAVPAATGNMYLKLTVPKLGKEGVAVDGDWNSLRQVSMVHYHDSPAPGARGNVLLAFHRETHWIDINQLKAGDQVQVQTRDLVVHTYQVDFVRIVNPSDVSLLRPTPGNDLTMISCDPPWHDYNRMVFRAHLVTAG